MAANTITLPPLNLLTPRIQLATKRSFCPRALPFARCNRILDLLLNQTVRHVATCTRWESVSIYWLIDWIVFHTLSIGNISAIYFDNTVFWENKMTPKTGRVVLISVSLQTVPNCFIGDFTHSRNGLLWWIDHVNAVLWCSEPEQQLSPLVDLTLEDHRLIDVVGADSKDVRQYMSSGTQLHVSWLHLFVIPLVLIDRWLCI